MPLIDACPPAPSADVVHLAIQLAAGEASLAADAPKAPGKATVQLRAGATQATYVVGWWTTLGKPRSLDGLGPNSWAKATPDALAQGSFQAHARLDDALWVFAGTAYPPADAPLPGTSPGLALKPLPSTDPTVSCWAGPAREALAVAITVGRTP